MSETMKCVRVRGPDRSLTLEDVAVPTIGPSDVLIDVEATSVGLTVYNRIHRFPFQDHNHPRIPGHEIVGVVEECGDGVSSLERGDRVAAYYYLSCDRCDACLSGHEPLCENLDGHVGVDVDGGFAEYARLPATNVIGLPDGVDPIDATVIPDAVATPYHVANQRATIEPGDRVMVLGAGGGVGIHLVQMVRHFGGNVTAVDQVDGKLDRCVELGADQTVNTARDTLADAVDGPCDAVVDFTGSMALIESAIGLLGRRGRFVNLTGFPDRSFEVAPRTLVRKEIEVLGSRYCSKYELSRAASLVADGAIEPVISEVTDLAGVENLLETIADGDLLGRGAVTP